MTIKPREWQDNEVWQSSSHSQACLWLLEDPEVATGHWHSRPLTCGSSGVVKRKGNLEHPEDIGQIKLLSTFLYMGT